MLQVDGRCFAFVCLAEGKEPITAETCDLSILNQSRDIK